MYMRVGRTEYLEEAKGKRIIMFSMDRDTKVYHDWETAKKFGKIVKKGIYGKLYYLYKD